MKERGKVSSAELMKESLRNTKLGGRERKIAKVTKPDCGLTHLILTERLTQLLALFYR